MEEKIILDINEKGWDDLIKSNKEFSNTSLPEYGPFMINEEKLQIFKNIKDKKVLELGCASGKSLEYLANKGAKELWGIDISEEQIKKARELNIKNSFFYKSPMEINPGIPLNYFDYVLSLYSIGYSCNPVETFKLASNYLRKDGKFIICWTHPFFNCLDLKNDNIYIKHKYNDEKISMVTKGPDKIQLLQYNLKISTIINSLIECGLEIDKVIEENPTKVNGIGSYKSPYFDERKLAIAPTTLIIVAHKKT